MDKKKKYWAICVVLASLLIILAFTPVALPKGVYKPMVLGLPFSLWFSFLITVSLVILTYIGAHVHPGADEEEGES